MLPSDPLKREGVFNPILCQHKNRIDMPSKLKVIRWASLGQGRYRDIVKNGEVVNWQ